MIEMYIKVFCPFCTEAKALLDKKGVSVDIYDIGKHPELKPEMVERAKGRTTVPQIFIHGQHVGGCDDLYALEHQGKLDALLKPKG